MSADQRFALASDPDRDIVWLASLVTAGEGRIPARLSDLGPEAVFPDGVGQLQPPRPLALQPGALPGRIAQMDEDSFLVVLRGLGELLHVEIDGGLLRERDRWRICAEARGVDYDVVSERVYVACRGGELVHFDPAEETPSFERVRIAPDLRDVVALERDIYVSTFVTAEIYVLNRQHEVLRRLRPDEWVDSRGHHLGEDEDLPGESIQFISSVAWRMRRFSAHEVVVSHQLARPKALEQGREPTEPIQRGGYGGSPVDLCKVPIVISATSVIGYREGAPEVEDCDAGENAFGHRLEGEDFDRLCRPSVLNMAPALADVLPVDVTSSGAEGRIVAGAGDLNPSGGPDMEVDQADVPGPEVAGGHASALSPVEPRRRGGDPRLCDLSERTHRSMLGRVAGQQPVAVARMDSGWILMQARLPHELLVVARERSSRVYTPRFSAALPGESREDTGHDLFHRDSGSGLACASCHPEGTEDGLVWPIGVAVGQENVRTPQIRGGILVDTAPLHWAGDMEDFTHLAHDVFSGRMAGPELPPDYSRAMERWIDTMPAFEAPDHLDPEAIGRGAEIFHRDDVGCVSCHSGEHYTNNATVDVGTGSALQVPPLVGLGVRQNLMHDGCATTLETRFQNQDCGGGNRHGNTLHLSEDEVGDLTTFLRSL